MVFVFTPTVALMYDQVRQLQNREILAIALGMITTAYNYWQLKHHAESNITVISTVIIKIML